MDQIFQIPGVIISDKSMANGARRFVVETQEVISPELLQRLITLEGSLGWFTFSARQIEAEDLIDLPEPDKTKYDQGKTPAQRLRSVIYVVFKQKGGNDEDFPAYYDKAMEVLIDQTKAKLE
jgi:hypothetical protein